VVCITISEFTQSLRAIKTFKNQKEVHGKNERRRSEKISTPNFHTSLFFIFFYNFLLSFPFPLSYTLLIVNFYSLTDINSFTLWKNAGYLYIRNTGFL